MTAFPSVPAGALRASVELPPFSPITEVGSEEHRNRAQSVMSMDDAETRMAAEELSGLRNPGMSLSMFPPFTRRHCGDHPTFLTPSIFLPRTRRMFLVVCMGTGCGSTVGRMCDTRLTPDKEFMRSPSTRSTTLSIPQQSLTAYTTTRDGEVEPLLSLVTTNHPWIGGTINGSLSAYNTTKNYSPAFVRSSAEFVERNIGSPIASTFATVSHHTGVEGGIRRYLGDRRPSYDDRDTGRKRKRLRESSPGADVEQGLASPMLPSTHRSRAGSQASFAESMMSLPPYDEIRSPGYEETPSATGVLALKERPEPPMSPARNWRTQLMITTSGLGAALSTTSLRNLRLCLKLLRNATDSLTATMYAIKQLIHDYEQSTEANNDEQSGHTLTPEQEEASRRVADRIKAFHQEIMQTLASVKNSISHYTGGALPENAGALVRRQLMSIPQRWRVAESTAAEQNNGTNEAVRSGNKLSVFASQSLDMIAQVTLIVSATIENAEGWLERMGKRERERKRVESERAAEQAEGSDVKMESVERVSSSGPEKR